MKRVWNSFLVNFINGVVILLPIALTVTLIGFFASKLNKMILDPVLKVFSAFGIGPGHMYISKTIAFIFVIIVITLFGMGAKILFVNRVFSLGEKILLKVPFMGRIYNAFKQIFTALFGHGKTIFKQVVMVEHPRKGLYSVGFTTGLTKGELKEAVGVVAINVFIPTTPNPTSGFFLAVPKEDVRFLKMSIEEGMKLIVSGGSVSPPNIRIKEEG